MGTRVTKEARILLPGIRQTGPGRNGQRGRERNAEGPRHKQQDHRAGTDSPGLTAEIRKRGTPDTQSLANYTETYKTLLTAPFRAGGHRGRGPGTGKPSCPPRLMCRVHPIPPAERQQTLLSEAAS